MIEEPKRITKSLTVTVNGRPYGASIVDAPPEADVEVLEDLPADVAEEMEDVPPPRPAARLAARSAAARMTAAPVTPPRTSAIPYAIILICAMALGAGVLFAIMRVQPGFYPGDTTAGAAPTTGGVTSPYDPNVPLAQRAGLVGAVSTADATGAPTIDHSTVITTINGVELSWDKDTNWYGIRGTNPTCIPTFWSPPMTWGSTVPQAVQKLQSEYAGCYPGPDDAWSVNGWYGATTWFYFTRTGSHGDGKDVWADAAWYGITMAQIHGLAKTPNSLVKDYAPPATTIPQATTESEPTPAPTDPPAPAQNQAPPAAPQPQPQCWAFDWQENGQVVQNGQACGMTYAEAQGKWQAQVGAWAAATEQARAEQFNTERTAAAATFGMQQTAESQQAVAHQATVVAEATAQAGRATAAARQATDVARQATTQAIQQEVGTATAQAILDRFQGPTPTLPNVCLSCHQRGTP